MPPRSKKKVTAKKRTTKKKTAKTSTRRLRGMREAPIRAYGEWSPHPFLPRVPLPPPPPAATHPEMKAMATLHEGSVTYLRHWNFWVRVGTPANTDHGDYFYAGYEDGSQPVRDLIAAVGAPTAWPRTEEEVWARIQTVWTWLGQNVRTDPTAYGNLTTADRWPSLAEFAAHYATHGELPWTACFSKAHLFACLLGRVLPRWHVTIASAHHTEGGAPPTASHVYVGVYLTGRWYYLDPTAVYSGPLPDFADRCSVGPFSTVDYEHPFSAIPVPLSDLRYVPHMPA